MTDRTKSIGASDAWRAINMDFALWAEKCGLADPPDLDEVERVQWGKRMEPLIVEAFGEKTGRAVIYNEGQRVDYHDNYPFLSATVDATQRRLVRGCWTYGALEVKNVDASLSGDWKDSPPLPYQVQLQHQLAVTHFGWGSLCALIGGNRLKSFDMEANREFQQAMFDKEREFWRLVETRTPPPVDGSLATEAALKRLYAAVDGPAVQLPDYIDDPNGEPMAWDEELQAAKAAIKSNSEKRRWIENHIRAAMKTATIGYGPGGVIYTLNETTRHNPPREASTSTFRVLRRQARR